MFWQSVNCHAVESFPINLIEKGNCQDLDRCCTGLNRKKNLFFQQHVLQRIATLRRGNPADGPARCVRAHLHMLRLVDLSAQCPLQNRFA